MVKAFHRADIEVILDIVLNHTAEGNELGPTICFRGIENSIFYMLNENDRRSLQGLYGGRKYFEREPPHRAGLHHGRASLLGDGDACGRFPLRLGLRPRPRRARKCSANAPLLERIAEDPILRDVKIIAEAWDAGGAYQVGSFSERRWVEWNGRFRDDVRRFWLGSRARRAVSQAGCAEAPICINDRGKDRNAASTSSRVMTGLR